MEVQLQNTSITPCTNISEPISSSLIDKVLSQAQAFASHSWEYGIVFEALLEYHNPILTTFHTPGRQYQSALSSVSEEVPALEYIKRFVHTDGTTLCEGNGSAADPASLGIPALFLSTSCPEASYLSAAQRQLDHLLHTVPRLPNGAISHREATTSAWADFVYMVPPFLAYYGVYSNDEKLVREAVEQCRLYCEILGTEKGPWKHILSTRDSVPGERAEDDLGLWSTSNGWAAAGMARVLATIQSAKFRGETEDEQNLLVKMIKGIVLGAMDLDTDASDLLRNYLDNETSWGEISGTALLAATVFRLAVLQPGIFGAEYTDWALHKMEVVSRHIDKDTGIAAPAVNPLYESQREPLSGPSPEGQAFVVLLYAAWRDWKTWLGAVRT